MKRPTTFAVLVLGLTACINAETIAYIPPDGAVIDTTVQPPDDIPFASVDTAPSSMPDATSDGAIDSASSTDLGAPLDAFNDAGTGGVVCLGTVCPSGDACCLSTGTCYDPINTSACPVPSRATDPMACGSNAHCAAAEYCGLSVTNATGPSCVGVGTCQARAATCFADGPAVCGCDGQTYGNACLASMAGVRAIQTAACGAQAYPTTYAPPHDPPPGASCDSVGAPICDVPGYHCDTTLMFCEPDRVVIACGLDSQCPTGQSCCAILGVCLAPSNSALCTVPPAGSSLTCLTDADCWVMDTVGEYEITDYYCDGPGGCNAVGGCVRPSGCTSGVLAPVCGCDGNTYVNACAASAAEVRAAHDGGCP